MTGRSAGGAGTGGAGSGDVEVRAEAGRLALRLEAARERFDDDAVRDLLAPALARVTRLHDIARSLADGAASDAETEQAARDLADTHPTRRLR